MLKLGKKIQYALVALVHLDRIDPGSRVSTHELSRLYGMPEQHLGKVLQKMSRAGLLISVQGVQGGYELKGSLADIRLGDLMGAVDPRNRDLGRPHTILSAFPACYVQGVAHEVERKVVESIRLMRLTEVLDQVPVPTGGTLSIQEAI